MKNLATIAGEKVATSKKSVFIVRRTFKEHKDPR